MELGRDVFNFRIPLWCIFTIAQSHNQSRLPRAVMTLAASIRDNSSASAASTLLQSHNSTISYFHNFTISQFITVVHVAQWGVAAQSDNGGGVVKQTSQRSLLFRQNVNRTEEEWVHFLDGYRKALIDLLGCG